MKSLTIAIAGLVVLVSVAVSIACSGGSDDDASSEPTAVGQTAATSQPTSTNQPQATTASSEPTAAATAAPATSTPEPTATAKPFWDIDFESLTPEAAAEPLDAVDAVLGGSPNRRASAAIADELSGSGLDLAGIEVFVFPVSGSESVYLIFEVDNAVATALTEESVVPLMVKIGESEYVAAAGVTDVVINLHDQDEQGPFTVVTVVPMTAVAAVASGAALGEGESQVSYEVLRP